MHGQIKIGCLDKAKRAESPEGEITATENPEPTLLQYYLNTRPNMYAAAFTNDILDDWLALAVKELKKATSHGEMGQGRCWRSSFPLMRSHGQITLLQIRSVQASTPGRC